MSAVAENSMADEEIGFRRPRNKTMIASDQDPQIPSIIQYILCESTISFFLSTFTKYSKTLQHKKKFTSATFRGLGCTTSSQMSVPKVIRSSADWQAKKVRKKKQRNPHTKRNLQALTAPPTVANPTSLAIVPDVWCSPGIAFIADTDPINCVIARRPVVGRGRVDGERMNHRERSYNTRPSNLEHISVLDSPSAFEILHSGADIYGDRYDRHFCHRLPGLAEIVKFQSSLLLGGGSDQDDQYRYWRLDTDNMSYEELLELGDRIGYVSNGLREDEILHCIRKSKNMIMNDLPSTLTSEPEWKCSICQEEYEADDDEVGKLGCGHSFHICCIKQWLLHKNACPVCKAVAAGQQ